MIGRNSFNYMKSSAYVRETTFLNFERGSVHIYILQLAVLTSQSSSWSRKWREIKNVQLQRISNWKRKYWKQFIENVLTPKIHSIIYQEV